MPVLTTLEKVKDHLGIPQSDVQQDDLLTQLIDQVEEIIGHDIRRGRVPGNHPLTSVEGTEYYDGPGREQLILKRRPITSVARVAVDDDGYYGKATDAFPSTDDWTEGEDFVAKTEVESEENPGILIALKFCGFGRFARGVWPQGRGNILVTYTAGYTTIPKDIAFATNQLVAAAWNSADIALGGPLSTVRLGDESYRLLTKGGGVEMLMVRRILAKYRD